MIRIAKPARPAFADLMYARGPHRGRHKFDVAREQIIALVARGTTPKSEDFDGAVYGLVRDYLHETVQHSKCCFCESKILKGLTHTRMGDVEHFRPKTAWRQTPHDTDQKPAYYWLAYDWDNLFFSCQICNEIHKNTLFPLLNPVRRATSHTHVLADERPVFIHPANENPEEYIGFRQEVAYGKDLENRGLDTIKGMGLDRQSLADSRKEVLNNLQLLVEFASLSDPRVIGAIQAAGAPRERYSAMVRANFPSLF